MEEKKYKVFLIDMDGTICDDIRNEDGVKAMADAKPFPDSIAAVNKLYDEGHFICIFTARTDEHKAVTEKWLRRYGVKYHQLLLNKPRRVGRYSEYHFIDNAKVRATTYTGSFTDFVKKKVEIDVFGD